MAYAKLDEITIHSLKEDLQRCMCTNTRTRITTLGMLLAF